MSDNVVDPHQRNTQRPGQGLGRGRGHQQRTDQPRAMSHRHRIKVVVTDAGLAQRFANDRDDALEVCPAGDLRHDARISPMQFMLGGDHVTADPCPALHHGRGGLIATRFDPQDNRVAYDDACLRLESMGVLRSRPVSKAGPPPRMRSSRTSSPGEYPMRSHGRTLQRHCRVRNRRSR